MDEFAAIIKNEGEEYYPHATSQALAWQYRDKAERLNAAKNMEDDPEKVEELTLASIDYLQLARAMQDLADGNRPPVL